jgi:hypothetical protein
MPRSRDVCHHTVFHWECVAAAVLQASQIVHKSATTHPQHRQLHNLCKACCALGNTSCCQQYGHTSPQESRQECSQEVAAAKQQACMQKKRDSRYRQRPVDNLSKVHGNVCPKGTDKQPVADTSWPPTSARWSDALAHRARVKYRAATSNHTVRCEGSCRQVALTTRGKLAPAAPVLPLPPHPQPTLNLVKLDLLAARAAAASPAAPPF